MIRQAGVLLLGVLLWLVTAPVAQAQPRRVTITIPAGIAFSVPNISVSTPSVPTSTTVAFTTANFRRADNFNVSVRADAAFFLGPFGTQVIPASRVSWTATTPSGVASNGTMSSASWVQVFASPNQPANGSVTMTWTLGPLTAAGLRAGTHTLTVRWRLEFL